MFGPSEVLQAFEKASVHSTFGRLAVIGTIALSSYLLGYVVNTLLFEIRNCLTRSNWFSDPYAPPLFDPEGKLVPQLKDDLGALYDPSIGTRSNHKLLVDLAVIYVESNDSDLYQEKIERRATLRNLEISISGVFLFGTVLTALQCCFVNLFAVPCLILGVYFLRHSLIVEANLAEIACLSCKVFAKRTQPLS
jgi:hypothetical protein